jgi:putative ABC transport system permease protein
MVFSPGTFAGAPHTDIATLTFADGGTTGEETALIKALADTFPTVSAVRVKEALETIDQLVGNLVLGLRGASLVALIAAGLVLGGALAAGQRFRIYDAVVLKTLGATRLRLLAAYAVEYLLIGCAAVVFGVAAGSIAAALVVVKIMEFSFAFVAVPAVGTALATLAVTVLLGLAGTYTALGHKPAEVLRNL